ncbi:hypothetical protein FACS189465_3020 [Clostridia bacterium]|nr:hypothetical protein FACS189465_3020 [Clostridia bacterium]
MKSTCEWVELRKTLTFTPEDEAEIKLEGELIDAICEAREKSKLTQEQMAKKSSISQSVITKLENGVCSPKVRTLIKLLVPMGYRLSITKITENSNLTYEQAKNTASFPAYSALAN